MIIHLCVVYGRLLNEMKYENTSYKCSCLNGNNKHTHTAQPHWWNDNKLFYHSYSFQFNRVTVVFSFVADITVHVHTHSVRIFCSFVV